MTTRLVYTPLNAKGKGSHDHGPPDPDGDIDLFPSARRPAIVTGATPRGRKRQGYARSASQRQERRRARLEARRANRGTPASRRCKGGATAKGGIGVEEIVIATPAAGGRTDDAAMSSPGVGVIENYQAAMAMEADDDEVTADDCRLGAQFRAGEFLTGKNDGNDEDSATGGSEDADSEPVRKRLFRSGAKRRRVILDEEEEEEEEEEEKSQEMASVDSSRSKTKRGGESGERKRATVRDEEGSTAATTRDAALAHGRRRVNGRALARASAGDEGSARAGEEGPTSPAAATRAAGQGSASEKEAERSRRRAVASGGSARAAPSSLQAAEEEAATKNSRRRGRATKVSARKNCSFEFAKEQAAAAGFEDEPAQGEKYQVTENNSPWPFRRDFSRVNSRKNNADTHLSTRRKSNQPKKATCSQGLALEDGNVAIPLKGTTSNVSDKKNASKKFSSLSKDTTQPLKGEGGSRLRSDTSNSCLKQRQSSEPDPLDWENAAFSDYEESSAVEAEDTARDPSLGEGSMSSEKRDLSDDVNGSDTEDSSHGNGLEVEYHGTEEDDHLSANARSMLLTQAVSQFMTQSIGSSTADAEHTRSMLFTQAASQFMEQSIGRRNTVKECQKDASEIDAGLEEIKGAMEFRSILLNTCAVSRMQASASQPTGTSLASSTSVEAGEERSRYVPANSGAHEEITGPAKSANDAKNTDHNTSQNKFATTSELAACRSQQSSTIHSKTTSPVAVGSCGGVDSAELERDGVHVHDRTTPLEGVPRLTSRSTARHASTDPTEEASDGMGPEEVARALEIMGYHVSQVMKIWKQASDFFSKYVEEKNARP